MKFTDLELAEELQKNLAAINFTECTAVQEQVIPTILEGKDISALSQTGTGKTAAFLLPLMDRILRSLRHTEGEVTARQFANWKKGQFVLVLVPTRELAEQVYQDVYMLKGEAPLEAAAIYGGTEYEEQKRKLAQGVQFVIGTPGRLIDLYKSHALDLRQVRAVVFDEADRMFDMGFKEDMQFVFQRIPKERQVLLFSATMNFDVLHTAYRFGSEPVEFNLSRDQVRAENVEDKILHVGQLEKTKYLLSLIKKHNPTQVIIFSNFKNSVDRIANFLSKNDVPALGISSLLTQAQRNRVISMFKEGKGQNILVATDVAARGLDIKNVDLVINLELPDDPENYVHRIGRTGRAGAAGKAFSLVSDRDVDALVRIEEYLKHKLEVAWLEDAELVKDFKAMTEEEFRRPKWEDRPKRHQTGGGGHSERERDRDRRHPRREQGRPHGEGQKRHQSQQSQPRDQRSGSASNGKPSPHQHKPRHQKHGKRPHAHHQQKPRQDFKRRPLKPVKTEGVLTKVGKFFKGLFGA